MSSNENACRKTIFEHVDTHFQSVFKFSFQAFPNSPQTARRPAPGYLRSDTQRLTANQLPEFFTRADKDQS
jgi:hypothetical protein